MDVASPSAEGEKGKKEKEGKTGDCVYMIPRLDSDRKR